MTQPSQTPVARVPFLKLLGVVQEPVEPGRSRIRLPELREDLTNLLPAAHGFPPTTVDAAFAAGIVLANDFDVASHLEAADRFEARGDAALATALRTRVARYRRRRRWRAWRRALTGRSRRSGR